MSDIYSDVLCFLAIVNGALLVAMVAWKFLDIWSDAVWSDAFADEQSGTNHAAGYCKTCGQYIWGRKSPRGQ